MAVEESSSQDATLIDDDLVAALGFEPVIEVSTDAPAEESDADDTATNGGVDHSVLDETVLDDASVDDAVVDDSHVEAEYSNGNGVHVDADALVSDVADDDVAVGDLAVDELEVDEAEPLEVESEADVVEVGSLDEVPSLVGDDDDGDLTAPVDLVESDLAVDDVDEVDEVETISDEAAGDEVDAVELIDLDQVDLTDAPAIDDEVQTLADADSVFADAGTVFDGEVDITETVPLVEPSEEVVGGAAVATAAAEPRKRYRRLRARKTRRVVRHIDPWSVLTFSVLFHMVVFAALLLSSVLVWNAAIASGMVENVESFIQELGDYETFEINADVMFRAAIVIAGMLTLASSVLVVLLTVVFNLISDLVGGIRVTVIEEETVRVPLDKTRGKATNE